MPAAKGKAELKLVVPERLKAQLDADAREHGLDRSTWICQQLEAAQDNPETREMARRLDELARDSAVMREDLKQVVTLIETFIAAVGKPPTSTGENAYPAPATMEETYPELQTLHTAGDTTVVDTPAPPAEKRWSLWSR